MRTRAKDYIMEKLVATFIAVLGSASIAMFVGSCCLAILGGQP